MRTGTQANVLVLTLIVIATLGGLVGIALNYGAHNGRLSRDGTEFASAVAIANGDLERMYSRWRTMFRGRALGADPTTNELSFIQDDMPDAGDADWHPGFARATFLPPGHVLRTIDRYGAPLAPDQIPPAQLGLLDGYKGWYSVNRTYEARTRVRLPSVSHDVTVEIGRTFTKSEAPIFQAALFFEDDLELHPGERMVLVGPVHTNGNLYAVGYQGKGLEFSSYVSYDKDYAYSQTLPPMPNGLPDNRNPAAYQAPDYTLSKAAQLGPVNRLEPAGAEMRMSFDSTDSNPNNDGYRELIEKPNGAFPDPAGISAYRMYNQASLKIGISQTTTGGTTTQSVTVLGKDDAPVSSAVRSAVLAAVGTRAPVYDRREQAPVSVTAVNVAALNTAIQTMNNDANTDLHFNGILYVSDTSADATKKAVRLENGAKLPTWERDAALSSTERGFTVASDNGIYIKGDYNTGGGSARVPSAVLGDAVMILSNNWNDTNAANPLEGGPDPNNNGGTLTGRQATNTTVNTAILAGSIPSGYDPTPNAPNSGDEYGLGGGAHNFPRFLENWDGVDFNFNGSMAQLFTSKTFTGRWATGDIYAPPNRIWSFDPNFNEHPSPGLFSATTFSRGPWRRY